MDLSYQDVLEILRIIDASDSQELILELGSTKLVVRKGKPGEATTAAVAPVANGAAAPAPAPATVAAPAALAQANGAARPATAHPNAVPVKAPMVGRFYRSASPDSPPFVEVGSVVEPNDVVCIVEVMKLFNQIKANVRGRVVAIAVENGGMVQFGQEMILVEPLD